MSLPSFSPIPPAIPPNSTPIHPYNHYQSASLSSPPMQYHHTSQFPQSHPSFMSSSAATSMSSTMTPPSAPHLPYYNQNMHPSTGYTPAPYYNHVPVSSPQPITHPSPSHPHPVHRHSVPNLYHQYPAPSSYMHTPPHQHSMMHYPPYSSTSSPIHHHHSQSVNFPPQSVAAMSTSNIAVLPQSLTSPTSSNAKSASKMTIQQAFDDLVARFFLNLPDSEYESFERVFFQLQEAHWFYIDFYCEKNPSFTRYNLKAFCNQFFRSCPLLQSHLHRFGSIYEQFTAYLNSVPVCGAILLNPSMRKVLMIQSFSKSWSFPRGKMDANETDIECAIREVKEEVGYDISKSIRSNDVIECNISGKNIKLFIIKNVADDFNFETRTRGEIAKIAWTDISELPTFTKTKSNSTPAQAAHSQKAKSRNFWAVQPFADALRKWIKRQQKSQNKNGNHNSAPTTIAQLSDMSVSSSTIPSNLVTPTKPAMVQQNTFTPFTPFTAPPASIPSVSAKPATAQPIFYTPSVRFYSRPSEYDPFTNDSSTAENNNLLTPVRNPNPLLSTSPSDVAPSQDEFSFDLDSILQPLSMVVAPVV